MRTGKAFLTVILTVIAIFSFQPVYGSVMLSDLGDLPARSEQEGRVRVIVTFGVSGLDNLQKASAAFKVSPPGRIRSDTDMLKAAEADASLAAAIKEAGSGIFRELGLADKVEHFFRTAPQALVMADSQDLKALAGHQKVSRVMEDKPVPVPETSRGLDDEKENSRVNYGVYTINAPQAWDKGYDGAGWYVAVLDTGVRTGHEMFSGKDIVEACFGTNNDFSTSLCPGGAVEAVGPGSAVPPDRFYHGTHVSAIAVGRQPNGRLSGVAPRAGLIAVQVFSYIEDWADVGAFYSDQLKGLEYVYGLRTAHSIASVNMSLGDGRYYDYCDDDVRGPVIDQLRSAGIAVTVSNGNDGYCDSLNSPACISRAVAVGGSDSTDNYYMNNDWHPVMQDIFAPGVQIYSAWSTGDADYGYATGTSMAAPHVAGAWAVFRQIAPTAEVSEIESVMEQSGTLIESGCETEPGSGPRLDVAAVVDHYLTMTAVPTANAGPDQVVDEGVAVTLDASASTSNSGHELTHAWVQTEGADITLSDPAAVRPTFDAPAAGSDGERLVFEVTVSDVFNELTDTDSVTVTVSDLDRFKPPTASAGPDQSVDTGTTVLLDGSGSVSNSNSGADLTHAWVQTAGIAVTLSDPTDPAPTFVGPVVDGASTIEFELLVVDGFNGLAGSDSVLITVNHVDNSVAPGFLPAVSHSGEIVGLKTGDQGVFIYLAPVDPASIAERAGRPDVLLYLFDTQIRCNPGAEVQVSCQLPKAAPPESAWYGLREDAGWLACNTVWTADRTVATITYTDGGDGDADGQANGVISYLSGLGYDSRKTDSDGQSGGGGAGCLLETSLK